MKKYFPLLQSCPLFAGIDGEDLEGMLRCLNAQSRRVSRGQTVFHEGDEARWVGIVLEGAVEIFRDDYDGSRSLLGRAGRGQLFGEVFACAGVETLPVTVEARQESVILLADCRRVLTVCRNACTFHNRLINNLLQVVAEKNMQLNRKIECMSRRTTREKLMAFLRSESKAHGSREFDIPFDRQALADYLGVERSAMSAELGKLVKDGVIECNRRHFRLL